VAAGVLHKLRSVGPHHSRECHCRRGHRLGPPW